MLGGTKRMGVTPPRMIATLDPKPMGFGPSVAIGHLAETARLISSLPFNYKKNHAHLPVRGMIPR